MLNKREWLRSNGFPNTGDRGRFHPDAQAALNKAIADGVVFDGPISTSPKAGRKQKLIKVDKTSRQAAVAKGSKTYRDVPEDPDPRYPVGTSYTYFFEGKKISTSERNACYTCGLSLQYHKCNTPKVVTYHGVQDVTIRS